MSQTNRGMSVSQARSLASDPKTSPGVLSRLANGYPEVWDDLLANPATYIELRNWILQAKQEKARIDAEAIATTASKPRPSAQPKPVKATAVKKIKTRGRRKYGRFLRTLVSLLVPSLAIYGLVQGVSYLKNHQPVQAVIKVEDLTNPVTSGKWTYYLGVTGRASCATYETAALEQDQAIVLVQNDLENKDCVGITDPVPSTLALVKLTDGSEIWKVDLATELDWTEKWSKHLVEIPGLNEIIVKFTDVNGGDVKGDAKSIDKGDDRKMKTLVPYNRLNGLITDPVIAKSKSQPIMQAPVLEVLPIPGNLRSVLVMTNGAKKDFRYAKYRSKRFSSPRWSVESDLKPMGGIPVVGGRLVLGREKGDQPVSIRISSGKFEDWYGQAAVKLYRIGKQTIEVAGDGVAEKATNIASQGDFRGHKIKITGVNTLGESKWTLESKGYAISRDDSRTNPINRSWYSQLFVLGGKNNREVSRVNPLDGSLLWTTKMSKARFEISRVSSTETVSVYMFQDRKLEAKLLSMLSLEDGKETSVTSIAGKTVRVDGATTPISVLVDEPGRQRIIKSIESGKRASMSSGEDNSDKIRLCAKGVDNISLSVAWSFECNGNQHILRVAGRWVLLDLSRGSESFWPLEGETND